MPLEYPESALAVSPEFFESGQVSFRWKQRKGPRENGFLAVWEAILFPGEGPALVGGAVGGRRPLPALKYRLSTLEYP